MQLITFPFYIVVLFIIAFTFGFIAVLVHYTMIGRVNRYLPELEQIPYVFTFTRFRASFTMPFTLLREHRRIYPNSPLPQICILLQVSGFVVGALATIDLAALLRH